MAHRTPAPITARDARLPDARGPLAPVVRPGVSERVLKDWSARALSQAAREMMRPGPATTTLAVRLQHLRPYICPFEKIMAHVERGSRVLDVGCGRGLLLGLLDQAGLLDRAEGRESIGFDCARGPVLTARLMARRVRRVAGPGHVRFERRDAAHLWPEGSFDAVTIVDVMHHVPAPHRRGLIRSAASRLRPGGKLIYKDMTSRSWRSVMNTMHDLAVAGELVKYTPVGVVEGWALDAGLRVAHAEQFDVLWYGHELRVFVK